MLPKFVSKLRFSKLFSSWLGVGCVSYSRHSYSPEQMILKSHVFLHACKTPLTVIRCCVDELSSDKNAKNDKTINSLEASITELQQLFAEASNTTTNNSAYFNLKVMAENLSVMLEWKFPNALIHCKIDPEIEIKGNKLYLEEALKCVATNALEAYRPGVTQHLHIIARKRRENIQIDIIDLGSGMSEAAKKLALLGGFSYKSDGNGIGLEFANYTIEKLFKGKMHIISQGGIGTRVTWHLPLS